MAGQTLKAKLQRIEALHASTDADALLAGVQRGLSDASSHVVAKAAAIAGQRYVTAAIPDLLAAFDRFFINAEVADRLVLAKKAIAQALKDLDYREPSPFVRGLSYVEPAWGSDRAAELRATCAHALVGCDMDGLTRLELLADYLVDDERSVRREVVRAIAQVGGIEAVLLLRMKALTGDVDAEVVGESFAALLDLEPRGAVAFVERFVSAKDDNVVFEAACALAGSRAAGALKIVRRLWAGDISSDLRHAIVFSCAASPLMETGEFLLTIIGEGRREVAGWALSALASSRFKNEFHDRALTAAEATADAEIVAASQRAFQAGRGV